MIEGIIFDFDGVITQSNYIRKQTYFDILKNIPNSKKVIGETMNEDLRRNRYGIIKVTLQKLKNNDLMEFNSLEQETRKYVNRYNEITEREVSRVPEISGATNTLNAIYKKYALFIITGTIQKSLDIVMRNRKLIKYFKKAYGNYRNKIEGMEVLLKEQKINPEKSVFVGDGKADYECAKHYNMHFVAVLNETNDFQERRDIQWKLEDLTKLPEIIEKINESTTFYNNI